jgi:hypothetical protein
MRMALFFCAAALLGSGCAGMLARSGIDPGYAKTRQQVHETFGEPLASGVTEGGEQYEDYCCHHKVSENLRASVLWLITYSSLGLADFYYFPCEIGRTAWKAVRGYDLRFQYDAEGRVTKHLIDGVPGMEWPFDALHQSAAAAPPLSGSEDRPEK